MNLYDTLEDFCEKECNMICKRKEKESKENCIINKFIKYVFSRNK